MYNPEFKLSHRIVNNLIKFEVEKASLTEKEIKESAVKDLEKRAKSLSLLHLGHMIGVNLTVKDAERVAEGKRIETDDHRGIILNNYRNVYEFIRSNATDTYVDIDLNILLHINKILLTDWKQPWESKFRLAGETVDNSFDSWTDVYDKSIHPVNIQNELNNLVTWYKANISKINPLIRIAVLIYRMIRIYPFITLNKISIIAITDYLLYKNGYLASTFIPATRIFDTFEDEFIDAWNTAIQSNIGVPGESNNEDITIWIERFIRNLSGDLQDSKDVIQKKSQDEERSVKQPFLDLNKRQLKILKYLQTIPTVKREDYVQMMNVSTMTAYRDINELVEKKLLKTGGQGRGTKYMLRSR